MGGQAFGNLMKAGQAHTAMSKQNQRRGPSNKNLASGATRRPNPTGGIKAATNPIKGPDKGAG